MDGRRTVHREVPGNRIRLTGQLVRVSLVERLERGVSPGLACLNCAWQFSPVLGVVRRSTGPATAQAYGWADLLDQLDHGFRPVGRDLRYTIGLAAQREILDRALLELNHERSAEEMAAGLHDKKKVTRNPKPQSAGFF